jgi:hypothetical protein
MEPAVESHRQLPCRRHLANLDPLQQSINLLRILLSPLFHSKLLCRFSHFHFSKLTEYFKKISF